VNLTPPPSNSIVLPPGDTTNSESPWLTSSTLTSSFPLAHCGLNGKTAISNPHTSHRKQTPQLKTFPRCVGFECKPRAQRPSQRKQQSTKAAALECDYPSRKVTKPLNYAHQQTCKPNQWSGKKLAKGRKRQTCCQGQKPERNQNSHHGDR
jgi:hypothetical protein